MITKRFCGLSGFLLLAVVGCGSPGPPHEVPATRPVAPAPTGTPFTGYHRYRGTVGRLPVTVELNIERGPAHDSLRCEGSYYYNRRGGLLGLEAALRQPQAHLVLVETPSQPNSPAQATWQAQQAPGPVLTGTWTSADGRRRLPFALREDYTGAVRYELLRETASGAACQGRQLQASREYLHLLGPDTLRPGQRALQCPRPAQRRAQLRSELAELNCQAEEYGVDTDLFVTYNGDGLLSLIETTSEEHGGPYPNGDNTALTYDLATGRLVNVNGWLLEKEKSTIAALFERHLRADSIGAPFAGESQPIGSEAGPQPVFMPEFGLNSEGLFCTLGQLGAPHVVQRVPITIPYAELRAYVRPNSPLARLITARQLINRP